MKKFTAEFIGTFLLVFFGTGSIIVNEQSDGALGLVGISLAFGIIIISTIYTLGSISGAHINPAVTIALWYAKLIGKKEALFYIIAQCIGAIIASFILKIIFPESINLGGTNPSGSVLQSFIVEIACTFMLMLTILMITQSGNKKTKVLAGLVIGLLIIGLILFAGPISGGSFNPARSLGRALFNGNLSNLWIYLTAPIIGGILAVIIFKKLQINKFLSFG